MKLSKYEQETVVNFNAEDSKAVVYTRDRTVMRKLDMLISECPDEYRLISSTDIDRTYEMPKSLVNFRRAKRLTEEQRAKAREQMIRINGK